MFIGISAALCDHFRVFRHAAGMTVGILVLGVDGLREGTDDLEEGSRKLGEFGISLIMITLGSEGVFYRCKGNSGEGDLYGIVPAEEVSVCDTNGAGDTFLGAVLAQIANNGSIPAERVQLEAMLTFANRAAALTCSRPGAIPAMPTLAELGEK
jgi:fructokinase